MSIDGLKLPSFIYGTAWKENDTQRLVELALQNGFRAIDTANQRKHYHEAAVGSAITSAIASGVVEREQLFMQTKFTFLAGQDQRLPYDPTAPIGTQVKQSFDSSLDHLQTAYVDSYLLHGPSTRSGLGDADRATWEAMEAIHDAGRTRHLGISNVSIEQLKLLDRKAKVRPRFVQNRCYASQGWDRQVREYCAANDVIYQGFSLLTANRNVLAHPDVVRIAKQHGRTVPQIIFRFACHVGIVPLTGTTNSEHMRADLEIFNIRLTSEQASIIDRIGERDGMRA